MTFDREIEALDAADPLAGFRERFALPEGMIYLDGNSLGPLPRGVDERVARTVRADWGEGLIRSWTAAGWIDLAARVGDRIAPLIGAAPGEVMVGDTTSVNLFKCLAAAAALRPERTEILTESGNFPTDSYMIEGLAGLTGRHRLRVVEGDPAAAIGPETAVVTLTHVSYRTAAIHDMARLTAAAHEAGALTVWDLSHSTGALPVDLKGAGADFAVGCTYKYLNGGPGAPAFVWVDPALAERVRQPLSGWLGHARPFDFAPGYEPAPGIARFTCGTPQILSLAALDAALGVWGGVDMAAVRAKSLSLTRLFIRLVEERCAGHGLRLVSPREDARRGSHVSFAHPQGYPIMQALIARGVIGDFRAPDLMRFGFAPLYLRHADVARAVEILAEVLATRAWDDARFHARAAVT